MRWSLVASIVLLTLAVAAPANAGTATLWACHGPTGHGGNGGPDLTSIPSAKNYNTVLAQVENGGGGMPAFKGQLTPKQIADVSTYVTQEITNNNK